MLRRSGLCNAGRCASSLWPLLIVLPGHALHLLWHVQTHIHRWENKVSSLLLWWLALYAIMKVHQTLGGKNLFTPLFLIYLMVFLKCNIFCPIYCSPTLIICCVWQIKDLKCSSCLRTCDYKLLYYFFFLAVFVLLCTFSLSCEPNRGQNVESFLLSKMTSGCGGSTVLTPEGWSRTIHFSTTQQEEKLHHTVAQFCLIRKLFSDVLTASTSDIKNGIVKCSSPHPSPPPPISDIWLLSFPRKGANYF